MAVYEEMFCFAEEACDRLKNRKGIKAIIDKSFKYYKEKGEINYVYKE